MNQQYQTLGPDEVIDGMTECQFYEGMYSTPYASMMGRKVKTYPLYKFRRPIAEKDPDATEIEGDQIDDDSFSGHDASESSPCPNCQQLQVSPDSSDTAPTLERMNDALEAKCAELRAELAAEKSKVEKLEKLASFARHRVACETLATLEKCDCGLDEAKSAVEGGKEGQ